MRYFLLIILLLVSIPAFADDGPIFRKNVSSTPAYETDHAAIRMLPLYVPAQASDGTLLEEGITYKDTDGNVVETREYARPLITYYTDGPVETIDEEGYGGFPGHGHRDAYGAVSLDDGATWKRTNLSQSGDLSSFTIRDGKKKIPYPGDVGRTFVSSDGNKVLVIWVSRYAGGGQPNYAMTDDERELVAAHLLSEGRIDDASACTDGDLIGTPCLYLEDHFSVAGSQGSSDLADEGYPLVGELPYAALWAARGVLMPPAAAGDPSTFVWFKAERLSSAVRDANRPEVSCVKGAGCVVTWQEDPDGIRPGEGDGPGEGWSGAIAHHQTDTWYSYIGWDDFGLVSGDGTYGNFFNDTGDLAEWVAENASGSPSAAIPMSIPVRLTDNAMCVAEGDKPYCYADFDGSGTADFCESSKTVSIEVPDENGVAVDHEVNMCVTEDGRLMRGTTASTRARLGLHGYSTQCLYDPSNPEACPVDSGWFYMAYEENKGLGDVCDDGYCEDANITEEDKRDMGKNVWYHTFDMFHPELVSQGLMLNQPAVYPVDWGDPTGLLEQDSFFGYVFYRFKEDPIYNWQAGITDATLYQTEIARRPSQISQDWYDAGPSGLVGLQLWKQGIVRRGGPADIMARRFVMPTEEVCVTETVCETEEVCSIQEVCTTTPSCTTETVCSTGEICEPNTPNPSYKPAPGLCKGDSPPSFCYPYFDADDNPTFAAETCEESEICEDVTTCEDVITCQDEEVCQAQETENCEDVTTCTVGPVDHLANPYDYGNMVCENLDGSSGWTFTDGSNPRYVKGLCTAPAINLSANTIIQGECGDAAACLDAFPFSDYFDDLAMGDDSTTIAKILTWVQTGPGFGATITDTTLTNLDDQSWENPYDMAKGHRGFMAGDMIMMMYGWTNNWKALTEAKDIVNLYNRRSFDGGLTWSTLPATFTHTNGETYSGAGTTTCEWMGVTGTETEYPVCTTYNAGDFEQARNVSQLLGHMVTVLDPRYSPTTRSITEASVSTASLPAGFFAPLYADDTRDPSRYFMVYETGHSSAYDAGEAPPLDLFYSRAVDWGDNYLVWADTASECLETVEGYPAFCNEFDAIEGSQFYESGEASVTTSPGGQFFYSVWNQIDFDLAGEEIGSDAWFRRVLFLDETNDGEGD